jgi:hypothetical protein
MVPCSVVLNRRSLLAATILVSGIPAAAWANQTPAPFELEIDPALLQPATEPANWDVEKNYNTETIPPAERTEYCDLKLFPYVPDSAMAISGMLQASDLNSAPNMVLVQEFRYADGDSATTDYSGVVHEVQTLAARKWYMEGIEAFTEVRVTDTESLVTCVAPNGAYYALLVRLDQDRILVLRAGANGVDPAPVLEQMAAGIIGSSPAKPAGGENANVEMDWEIDNWRWNYGPIDIHPDRYHSPVCQ